MSNGVRPASRSRECQAGGVWQPAEDPGEDQQRTDDQIAEQHVE
jgi:hypothetical protein